MLLESDQKLVDAIPAEIHEKISGFSEHFKLQVGFAWDLRNDPLPENYIPESVDVFVDGSEDPCLFVYQRQLKLMNKEFFAERHKTTVVISIEDTPRYVQVHGELIVDALGDCVLPDVLVSPEAQLSCLTKLL